MSSYKQNTFHQLGLIDICLPVGGLNNYFFAELIHIRKTKKAIFQQILSTSIKPLYDEIFVFD